MASATFWPSLNDYKASVQNPQNCFSNEELRRGQVFTDRHGLPVGASGNSAVVYQFKSGNRTIAVRCFIQPVTVQQQHYTALNQHLTGLQIPGLAGFEYMLQGIRLRGHWYPIIKMEWVEGKPLHTFVEPYRHNPYALLRLATELRVLMNNLHGNHIAHGDLQHDNVRVDPLLHMRLVDYDTMFVPSLRGILSPEIGLANYQHPQRTNQDYNENLDNFSALVIYTSLLALATHPDLWQQHHTGENLIFSANDYKEPQQSVILQKLKRSTNPEVQKLAAMVEQCCRGTMAQVPKLDGVIAIQNIQQRVIISPTQHTQPKEQTPAAFRLPLRFESLRFYEDDSHIPPREKRRYGTYFPQSVARYIYFELNLNNELWKQRDHTYRIEWRFYAQNGRLISQGHKDWVVKDEWKTCWYSEGFGRRRPDAGHREPIAWKSSLMGSNIPRMYL